MTKKLPTHEKAVFLLCEDVRQEGSGKFSLLGMIPANNITTETRPEDAGKDGLQVLPSLTFVFIFRDGEGEFAMRVGVIAPDGKELAPSESRTQTKAADEALNSIFKLAPFVVNSGKYRAYVLLDSERYEYEFVIQEKKA